MPTIAVGAVKAGLVLPSLLDLYYQAGIELLGAPELYGDERNGKQDPHIRFVERHLSSPRRLWRGYVASFSRWIKPQTLPIRHRKP
jgi:hypothetical protein